MLSIGLVVEEVARTYLQILFFPLNHPDFVPSLIPLFIGLVIVELYFGRYVHEQLGWESAVSNATLLLTTGLTLIYELNIQVAPSSARFNVAYGIVFLGAFILLMNFYHVWPERLAYNLSSAFLTYTGAYLAIAIVYEGLPLTPNTVAATGLFFASLYFAFSVLQMLETPVLPPGMKQNEP